MEFADRCKILIMQQLNLIDPPLQALMTSLSINRPKIFIIKPLILNVIHGNLDSQEKPAYIR